MKIAVFSDIHGNLPALEAIFKDIKSKNINEVYYLGDISTIGPSPKECLDKIIDSKINLVLGNHDLYVIRGTKISTKMGDEEKIHQKWVHEQIQDAKYKEFLSKIPLKIVKKMGKIEISFQHFLFKNENSAYPFEELTIIKDGSIKEKVKNLTSQITFVGHSHEPFEIETNNKKLICVGSSGCRKDDTTFYTIVNIENEKITLKKVELKYNRTQLENAFKKMDYPSKKIIAKVFFGVVE